MNKAEKFTLAWNNDHGELRVKKINDAHMFVHGEARYYPRETPLSSIINAILSAP